MQPGKVLVWMRLAIALDHLLELVDERAKRAELRKLVRQDVVTHEGQLRHHVDDGTEVSLGRGLKPRGHPLDRLS